MFRSALSQDASYGPVSPQRAPRDAATHICSVCTSSSRSFCGCYSSSRLPAFVLRLPLLLLSAFVPRLPLPHLSSAVTPRMLLALLPLLSRLPLL